MINKVFIRIAGYFLVALISSIISASALFFTQLLPLIDYRCSSRLWHNIHWSIGFALSWHCGVITGVLFLLVQESCTHFELQRQEQLHEKQIVAWKETQRRDLERKPIGSPLTSNLPSSATDATTVCSATIAQVESLSSRYSLSYSTSVSTTKNIKHAA